MYGTIATNGKVTVKVDVDGRAWLRITDGGTWLSIGFLLTNHNQQQVLELADHIVFTHQCEAHDREEATKIALPGIHLVQ